ncbi:MAG TPA: PAS domain S-box protein [Longimicrobiaceae bacterium]
MPKTPDAGTVGGQRGATAWHRGLPLACLVAYAAADVLARMLARGPNQVVPWYPAAGFGLAFLVLAGWRRAPVLALVRAAVGISTARYAAPAVPVVVDAVLVTAVYAASAVVVCRYVPLEGEGWRVQDAAWLATAVLGGALLSALPGGAAIVVWKDFPWDTFPRHVLAFWAGDVLGGIVVLPLVLFVALPALRRRARAAGGTAPAGDAPPRAPRRGEHLAQGLALCASALAALSLHPRTGLFGALPCSVPLAWMALRDRVRGAALASGAYAALGSVLVYAFDLPPREVLQLQFLLLTLALMGLFLGAAQTAVLEGEARYTRLAETAEEGIWQVDREGRTVYANDRLAGMLGYRPDELMGRCPSEFVEAWEAPRMNERLNERLLGKGGTYDVAMRRRDGTPVTVRVHGTPVRAASTGEVLGSVAMLTDVTELRVMESLRKQSEELMCAVFHTSRDGMILFRAGDEMVVDVNEVWTRITGLPREAVVGRSQRALGVWEDPRDLERLEQTLREHGSVSDVELGFVRRLPGGGTEPGRMLLTLHPASRQGTPYFLGVVREVTEQRRVEQQRQQLQRLEELGRLAGGVAHDFNNLLTVITAYTQLARQALDGLAAPEAEPELAAAAADLREVELAAARAGDLTSRLLAFSRHRTVAAEPTDLNQALADTRGLLQPLLGIARLVYRPGAGVPTVLIDRGQLQQLVMNLAVNARDAMPDGGYVTLATRREVVAPGEVAQVIGPDVPPGEYAVLEVSDTGTGMDDATRARIFEPFFTTKEPGKGTGLGLAVVYGVVRQAGGGIRVESWPGSGTTFTVYLPAASGPVERRPGAPEQDADGHAARVLVVEDTEAVRAVITRVLSGAGYDVAEAGNGREAVARLESLRDTGWVPDLVLSDVVMPEMGGVRLVERLHALHPALPVVLISGYAVDDEAEPALHLARHPLLPKPFTPADLLRAVRQALPASSAE